MTSLTKVAIITGASRGIGRAIALSLASDGFAVVVNYADGQDLAEELVAHIIRDGGRAIALRGEVSDPEQMERVFTQTRQEFKRLDVVVNSASTMLNSAIEQRDLELFDQLVKTNLRGSFIVLGLAAQYVDRGGRIIALSTSAIAKATPTYGPYIASKAGIEALVHVLANELRGREIRVNAIAPGPVATEMFLRGKTAEQIAHLANIAPLERLGTPEDIAGVVSAMVGEDGAWLNAQVIRANGGFA